MGNTRPRGRYRHVSAFGKILVSIFILWQLLMTALWLMPASATQRLMLNTLHVYMWVTGCDQNWAMFSPNPANIDVYLQANIFYKDGTHKVWSFPRMHNMGFIQRYQAERYRKMIENAHLDMNSGVWPYLAQFAALSNDTQPKTNPVVQVELIRSWQVITTVPGNSRSHASSHRIDSRSR